MSADTRPISPSRFAAALKDLSISMLHLKVLEIRNSIAHLQYSNDQLKPFAEGSAAAITATDPTTTSSSASTAAPSEPDQDCIDAIRENELVVDRMMDRIALIKTEVEERGVSWTEFQSKEEVEAGQRERQEALANGDDQETMNDTAPHAQQQTLHTSSPWTDGTFQTGMVRNGEVTLDAQAGRPNGGTLDDEQLRRALEERMRQIGEEDDDDGMHL